MNANREELHAKYTVWKNLTEAYEAHISAMWAGKAQLDDEFKELIKKLEIAHADFMGASKHLVG
jgi:hypothetical protein